MYYFVILPETPLEQAEYQKGDVVEDPGRIYYTLTAALIYCGWTPGEIIPFEHIYEVTDIKTRANAYCAEWVTAKECKIVGEVPEQVWAERFACECASLYERFKTVLSLFEGHNAGLANSGKFNAGDFNGGDFNTGDFNIGCCNSGDFNAGNNHTGVFNTALNDGEILMFNYPSDWTIVDWRASHERRILHDIILNEYIRDIPRQKSWDCLPYRDKESIMSLPNFDPDIFYKCTGIKVNPDDV